MALLLRIQGQCHVLTGSESSQKAAFLCLYRVVSLIIAVVENELFT